MVTVAVVFVVTGSARSSGSDGDGTSAAIVGTLAGHCVVLYYVCVDGTKE